MEIRTTDSERSHLRELLVEDRSVSRLTIIDFQMRIGTAAVRMAGIADVHTDWAERNKGHMRRLFEDSLTYMRDQDYDVSMLFGIRNLYDKFGYAVCLPSHKFEIKTRDAEQARATPDIRLVRAIAPEQMEAVLSLYNRNNTCRSCSIVRNVEHFPTFAQGSWWGVEVEHFWLADASDQLLAYAVCDKSSEAVSVTEVESADDRLFSTLLHEFAEMAIERRCGEIALHMAPDHPFVEYVQRFGCKRSTETPKTGGGMMRIINQETLLRKIRPELERRLAACTKQFQRALALRTDIGETTLFIDGSKVVLTNGGQANHWVKLSQDKLTQLIVGHRSARDVLNAPDVETEGQVEPLLDVLFPRGHPYVWAADRF